MVEITWKPNNWGWLEDDYPTQFKIRSSTSASQSWCASHTRCYRGAGIEIWGEKVKGEEYEEEEEEEEEEYEEEEE